MQQSCAACKTWIDSVEQHTRHDVTARLSEEVPLPKHTINLTKPSKMTQNETTTTTNVAATGEREKKTLATWSLP